MTIIDWFDGIVSAVFRPAPNGGWLFASLVAWILGTGQKIYLAVQIPERVALRLKSCATSLVDETALRESQWLQIQSAYDEIRRISPSDAWLITCLELDQARDRSIRPIILDEQVARSKIGLDVETVLDEDNLEAWFDFFN